MKRFWFLLLLSYQTLQAQDFERGYQLLETGKFAEGADFFKKYLQTTDSTNRTARLCYGRGIGLSGSPELAQKIFTELLKSYPNDLEIQLNWAECSLWNKQYATAFDYYQTILNQHPSNTDALLGSVNALSLQSDFKKALLFAQKACETAITETNKKRALFAKINTLGLNKRFSDAFAELEKAEQQFTKNSEITLLKARLSVWGKHYGRGVSFYEEALQQSPNSFDANLGLADAQHAQGMDDKAYQYVRNTLMLFPKQADANNFIEKLNLLHAPSIESNAFVSQDNGKNTSFNYWVRGGLDLHPRLRCLVSYNQRTVGNIDEPQQAKAQTFLVGFVAKPFTFLKIEAALGKVATQSYSQKNQATVYQIATEWRLGAWQQLGLKYNQEAQSFTAGLIDYQLFHKNYIANYNLSTPFNVGFYGQAIHSTFSDNNSRNLFFASLYYDFSFQPVIKVGINYQQLTFEQRRSRIYFSPFEYTGKEIFLQAENLNVANKRWLCNITAAIGKQTIEDETPQTSYRLNASITYRHNKRIESNLYANRSNTATSTVMGYTYNELGIKVKMIFL